MSKNKIIYVFFLYKTYNCDHIEYDFYNNKLILKIRCNENLKKNNYKYS